MNFTGTPNPSFYAWRSGLSAELGSMPSASSFALCKLLIGFVENVLCCRRLFYAAFKEDDAGMIISCND